MELKDLKIQICFVFNNSKYVGVPRSRQGSRQSLERNVFKKQKTCWTLLTLTSLPNPNVYYTNFNFQTQKMFSNGLIIIFLFDFVVIM